jgi:hypothetical protein
MTQHRNVKVMAWGGDAPQACHDSLQPKVRRKAVWPDRPEARVEVAVVGAGLSGLAAAYSLSDREVMVLEGGSQAGGVCLPGSFRGVPYPAGSAYFYNDPADLTGQAWFRELGLKVEDVLVAPPASALFDRGQWYPDCFSPAGIKDLPLSPGVRDELLRFVREVIEREAKWDPLASPFMTHPEWDMYSYSTFSRPYGNFLQRSPPFSSPIAAPAWGPDPRRSPPGPGFISSSQNFLRPAAPVSFRRGTPVWCRP